MRDNYIETASFLIIQIDGGFVIKWMDPASFNKELTKFFTSSNNSAAFLIRFNLVSSAKTKNNRYLQESMVCDRIKLYKWIIKEISKFE